MFEIVEKRELAENIYLTRVKAPRIARSAQPGQFVIVRADKVGERTPLTIADYRVLVSMNQFPYSIHPVPSPSSVLSL